MAPEEAQVFDLIGLLDLWHLKHDAFQTRFKSMSSNAQIKDVLLYEIIGSAWLP